MYYIVCVVFTKRMYYDVLLFYSTLFLVVQTCFPLDLQMSLHVLFHTIPVVENN